MKHADKISKVTFWGINDANNWLTYPPFGNQNLSYPLLFDRSGNPKKAFWDVIALVDNSTRTPSSGDSPKGTTTPTTPSSGDSPKGTTPTSALVLQLKQKTTWNNGAVYSYEVVNNSTQQINQWRIKIILPQRSTLSANWCIESTADSFVYKNAFFNGNLAPGSKTEFGFQISHNGDPEVQVSLI
jgi:hypothetical protein